MKKLSIILFGALLLASCGGGKGPDSISGKVIATLENLPDSKVSLDWRLRTAWDDDDALCVFDHSAAPRRYNLESKSEMSDETIQGKVWSVGTFTAASSSSLGDRNLDRLYAVAPWTGAESMASNGVISINMPERQTEIRTAERKGRPLCRSRLGRRPDDAARRRLYQGPHLWH